MESLPTTTIGLIAFIVVVFIGAIGAIIRYFFTYIEKKNNHLERTAELFVLALADRDKRLEERDKRFDDALIKQNDRHEQMMDDMAARMESLFTPKT